MALVGRLAGARDGTVQFSGSLANVCALADLKLGRLLDTFDAWADRAGVEAQAPQRFAPTAVPAPALSARLGRGGIESVVWATGFRPDLSFLNVPVFDRKGRVVHDGGITPAPGLYVMGLPFLRRRRSTLIDGADADARDLAEHLVDHLDELAGGRAERSSVMQHHPVAADIAALVAGRDPRAAGPRVDRDRAVARPAARWPDPGARARRRRRLLPRLLRRLRHRAARGVGGRASRRPPAHPLPPARDAGREALGVHPDRGLQVRRRAPGCDRSVVLGLPGGFR